MDTPNNPHDRLFRLVFSRPSAASAFLQSVLPEQATEALDWSALKLEPGTLVEPSFRDRHSDLLFLTEERGARSKPRFVYLLLEHQSTPDPDIELRLLGYMVRIWERWRAEKGRAPLPPILPCVLYHGARPWAGPEPGPRTRQPRQPSQPSQPGHSGEAGGDPFEPYHPSVAWHLYWIQKRDRFEALRHHAEVFLALHLLARATQGEMREILPLLPAGFGRILERPEGPRVSGEMVMYITQQGSDIRADELKAFLEGKMGTKQGGQVMSEFDRVMGLARQEGRAEGWQEGREEGWQEGRQEGRQEGWQEGLGQGKILALRRALIDLIRIRLGSSAVTPAVEQQLERLDIDGLSKAIQRAATAERLEDIFK
jgi:predicted transposase YdaD